MNEIIISDVGKTEAWCMKHIGPRLFYLHNRIGGTGWVIDRHKEKIILRVQDKNQYLMALIKFGK